MKRYIVNAFKVIKQMDGSNKLEHIERIAVSASSYPVAIKRGTEHFVKTRYTPDSLIAFTVTRTD